jgi:hypothetical protein
MAGTRKTVEPKGEPMNKDGLRQAKQKWKDNMIKAIINDDLFTVAALIMERPYWDTMEAAIDIQEAKRSLTDRVLAIEKTLRQTSGETGLPGRFKTMEERIEEVGEGLDRAFQEIDKIGKPRPRPSGMHYGDGSEATA